MSLRTETRYYLACDMEKCDTEHHNPADDSALSARISAGMAGWSHISAKPGRYGKGKRLAADLCPQHSATKERR